MNTSRMLSVLAVSAATLVAACESSTDVADLLPDAIVEADVAASAGDAIATTVSTLAANQTSATLSNLVAGESALTDNSLTVNRTRTCFDEANAPVVDCQPMSSVRLIVTNATLDGTRSGSNPAGTVTWSGSVHRSVTDSLTRIFTSGTEGSRSHTGTATSNDTTTFEQDDFMRFTSEAAVDSVKQLTWTLPRSSNPWPVSGSIVRVVNVKFNATRGTRTQSRELNRTIQVTFPADAQGNVVLVVNSKTCNLNLVTHAVTGCV